jgi:predicted ATPase
MNMRRRGERTLHEKSVIERRRARGEEIVPWADPYIAGLIREHERQMRAERKRE